MKKENFNISSPDDLNKHLQRSSPVTWIILGVVVLMVIGFFTWSIIYRIKVKVSGYAKVISGVASLNVDSNSLSKIKAGQVVHISSEEGFLSFDEEKKPIVSGLTLNNGDYTYYIIVQELRPFDFLIK